MIYLYWLLAAPTGALAVAVLGLTVTGKRLSSATPDWLSLLASAAVIAMLVWSYRMATSRDRPGAAAFLVVLSWIVFAGSMISHALMTQTLWN